MFQAASRRRPGIGRFHNVTFSKVLKRPAVVALGLAATVWSISVVFVAAQAPSSPADRGMLAGEAFKNVQAMKDVPVDDFLTSMGLMCAALGNDCADCHQDAGTQYVDWAADTPRKRTARRMVTMVNTINKDNFGGRVVVTCWTCHRNRDRPETTPTMDVMYGEPLVGHDDVITQRAGAPTAASILDKYVEAIGGTERLSRLTSYVATATSTGFGGFGGGGKVQIYAQAPDKRTTIIQFPEAVDRGDSTRSYNGTEGWIRTPLSVLGEYKLKGTELDGARFDALMGFPQQIKQVLTNTRVSSAPSIDGKAVQLVQGEGPNGLLVSLYFDTQSGLLTRMIRYGRTPIGRIPTQVDFAEYHDVGGVKMPFRWTFSWLDGREQFQITDVKTNVTIDRNRFEKPSRAIQP
jgi:photosynthetic reaction center cytochrome c subunit